MISNFWRNFDAYLFISAVLLNILGLVVIFSHIYNTENVSLLINQLIFSIIGILFALFISRMEYRSLNSFAPILFYISLFILFLVLIFGSTRNGTTGWFDFGFVSLQPSEFTKITFILYTSYLFAKTTVHTYQQVLYSIISLLAPIILILLEPDLGTSLVFIAIWLCIILSLNLRTKQLLSIILSALLTAGLLLTIVISFFPKDNFQYQRIILYPDHLFLRNFNHQDIGYQVDQAIIAVGNGGLSGQGLNNGSQTRLGFLPENNTDFIFSSIAEEIGFIASILIIILFAIILYRIITIARLAQDKFGRYIATGAFGFFFYHFVQNIGMNVGLLPVTGIPLSFLSYGGSHLLTSYLFVGLLESIILRYKKIKY